ncbi:MAG: PHB depolymerase family esterase [Lysobacterales bacterium]|jgi:hypothetical protein
MSRSPWFALLFIVAVASAPVCANGPVLRIDPQRVTVSGMSAGGHMAHQLHVAYSDVFSGAGIIAAGPYGCARGSLQTAFARCVSTTGGDLPPDEFIEDIRTAAEQGRLADPGNLADDRAWLFHGALDQAVAETLSDVLYQEYLDFIPAENVAYVKDVPAAHNFPAAGKGHDCGASEAPFVGNCGYDAAGQLLQHLYPGLQPPAGEPPAPLTETTLPGAAQAALSETAWLYIPARCTGSGTGCALHLVLHGCAQSSAQVGTAFIEQSGYLPWAEANDIILAFPQVAPSAVNPLGCWDWWGYTGPDYRWRNGSQMRALTAWLGSLQDGQIP